MLCCIFDILALPFRLALILPAWMLLSSPLIYLAMYTYLKISQGWCTCKTCLVGKTVLITGANTGLGKETAKDMACRGARVIVACRDIRKGEEAVEEIIAATGNRNVVCRELDLASFASVRRFAEKINAEEERLDILINNAGIANRRKRELTEDKLELAMQTNHFGHFLLTNLLEDLLVKSAPSRVVVLSSLQHLIGDFDPEGILTGSNWNPHLNYPATKLVNVMFANEFNRRMKDKGVTANSVHPGTVKTQIYRLNPKSFLKYIIISFIWPMFKSVDAGIQTIVHVAVSRELDGVGGKYFADCKEGRMSAKAKDPEALKRMWEWSARATGLDK